jgi:fucose permease
MIEIIKTGFRGICIVVATIIATIGGIDNTPFMLGAIFILGLGACVGGE